MPLRGKELPIRGSGNRQGVPDRVPSQPVASASHSTWEEDSLPSWPPWKDGVLTLGAALSLTGSLTTESLTLPLCALSLGTVPSRLEQLRGRPFPTQSLPGQGRQRERKRVRRGDSRGWIVVSGAWGMRGDP